MTKRQRQAKHAAEHRHWRDRLLETYAAAEPAVIQAGCRWYPAAETIVAALSRRYGQPRPQIAGVLAALSPQQRWRRNVISAVAVLEGEHWRAAGYEQNVAKAQRIAAGERALDVLGGDKVLAFWANLIGSRYAITVDTWAQRAAIGRMAEQPKGARYGRIASAYAAAAEIIGEHPREFQASIWLATRPMTEHHKDNITIGELI